MASSRSRTNISLFPFRYPQSEIRNRHLRFPKSLHDPAFPLVLHVGSCCLRDLDRKSTRLNSSHLVISYAVFCLKKKTNNKSCYACRPHVLISPLAPPRTRAGRAAHASTAPAPACLREHMRSPSTCARWSPCRRH